MAVYGFLNPVFGVLLSAPLLREGQHAFTQYSLAAMVLVCVGIFVVNRIDIPRKGSEGRSATIIAKVMVHRVRAFFFG